MGDCCCWMASRNSSPGNQSQNMDIAAHCSLSLSLFLSQSLQELMLHPLVAKGRVLMRGLAIPAGRAAAEQCPPAAAHAAHAAAAAVRLPRWRWRWQWFGQD